MKPSIIASVRSQHEGSEGSGPLSPGDVGSCGPGWDKDRRARGPEHTEGCGVGRTQYEPLVGRCGEGTGNVGGVVTSSCGAGWVRKTGGLGLAECIWTK